jgi:hypothetical protein
MKFKTLIIVFLCFSKLLFSQDSLRVETVVDSSFSPPQYVGAYDYVFTMKEPRRQLFKINIAMGPSILREGFSYEQKIGKAFSLQANLELIREQNTAKGLESFLFKEAESLDTINFSSQKRFNIEPRWYFNMKRDMREGLIADNLNGSYIGMKVGNEWWRGYDDKTLKRLTTELVYGFQRRILTNQYIDFNIGLGYGFGESNWSSWILNYQLNYGVLFDKRSWGEKPKNCDALQCFEEENKLLKIDILNLVQSLTENGYSGTTSIEYERKIGHSVWSVNSEVQLGYDNSKNIGNQNKRSIGYQFKIAAEPRVYFQLKERIANGESANNLSGNFFGLNLGFTNSEKTITNKFLPANDAYDHQRFVSAAFVFGNQTRLLNQLFLGYRMGLGGRTLKGLDFSQWKGYAVYDMKLGLCF